MDFQELQAFSKASLVGLKAELARKQEEVLFKQQKDIYTGELKIRGQHLPQENKCKQKNKPGTDESVTVEEAEVIDYSRQVLLAKSDLYKKLCNKELVSEEKSSFLVNFDEKPINGEARTEDRKTLLTPANKNCSVFKDSYLHDDDGWVEYTDSLGRTRKCLKNELKFYKMRDAKLFQRISSDTVVRVEDPKKETSAELQSFDMKREELRKKWEEEEIELMKKKDIHYQDVLFDEARVHGMGYYQFSKDEAERKKQQDSLLNLRKDTEEKQKEARSIKEQRDAMLKSRLDAARRRKRERLGLPPDEECEENQTSSITLENGANQNEEEEEKKKKEMKEFAERIKENLEKIRRSIHVRPWDVGKDGVGAPVMSQEEWLETQRSERVEEFAPPTMYKESYSERVEEFDPPAMYKESNCEVETNKNPLIFTSKKPKLFTRNVLSESELHPGISFHPTAIVGDTDAEPRKKQKLDVPRNGGAKVPPPCSYAEDTSISKRRLTKSADMKESVDAGFGYLKRGEELMENRREKGFLL